MLAAPAGHGPLQDPSLSAGLFSWCILFQSLLSCATKKKMSFYDENSVCFFLFIFSNAILWHAKSQCILFCSTLTDYRRVIYWLDISLLSVKEKLLLARDLFYFFYYFLKKTFSFVFICCHSESASIFGVLG